MDAEKSVHPVCLSDENLISDCNFQRTRSSGPGGQHRNKVETTVVVTHRPSGVTARAGERRSQNENKEIAVQRLRMSLAVELRSRIHRESPSDLWGKRCVAQKIVCNSGHRDFACLMAEALDFLAQDGFQVAVAAAHLNCSTSQLIKFIKKSDQAFNWVNNQRKALNLAVLR